MNGLHPQAGGRQTLVTGLLAVLLFALSACSVDPGRQEAADRFEQANQLYAEGRFDEALHLYLQIAESGFSAGSLFYNIGNCYYRRGEIGESILYYERARRLLPADEDLAHNLELSRLRVVDKIDAMPEFWLIRLWKWVVHLLSPTRLNALLAASWLGFVAALIGWLLGKSAWKRWSSRAARVLGLVLLLGGVCFLSQWHIRSGDRAVVTAASTRAFGAPGGGGIEVFDLHEGVTVQVDEIRDGWVEIVLADGNHGWVRAEDVEII